MPNLTHTPDSATDPEAARYFRAVERYDAETARMLRAAEIYRAADEEAALRGLKPEPFRPAAA